MSEPRRWIRHQDKHPQNELFHPNSAFSYQNHITNTRHKASAFMKTYLIPKPTLAHCYCLWKSLLRLLHSRDICSRLQSPEHLITIIELIDPCCKLFESDIIWINFSDSQCPWSQKSHLTYQLLKNLLSNLINWKLREGPAG